MISHHKFSGYSVKGHYMGAICEKKKLVIPNLT